MPRQQVVPLCHQVEEVKRIRRLVLFSKIYPQLESCEIIWGLCIYIEDGPHFCPGYYCKQCLFSHYHHHVRMLRGPLMMSYLNK